MHYKIKDQQDNTIESLYNNKILKARLVPCMSFVALTTTSSTLQVLPFTFASKSLPWPFGLSLLHWWLTTMSFTISIH